MNKSLLVVRAIAVEFAKRIYTPIAIIFYVAVVIVIGLLAWLTTVSAWWWIFLGLVIVGTIIGAVVLIVVGLVLRFVKPDTTKTQNIKVRAFVDKLQRLSEITQTPKILLLFRAIKDIASPSKHGFIQSVATDTTSLKKDFQELLNSF